MVKQVILSAFVLWFAGFVQADLIQHLDATVSGSVTGSPVTRWTDQTGNSNHATPSVGSVYYPSSSLSTSGLAGLNFGTTRNSLELFNAAESDNWLNFTGSASGNNGFCVLIAFKCDALMGTDWNDLIGNTTIVGSGFLLRYSGTGTMQAVLDGAIDKSGFTVAGGDTIVYAFNYNASTGQYEWWESKNDSSVTGTKAATDFSENRSVTVGSTNSSSRYINGMVGEIKIYDSVLDSTEFQIQRDDMVSKWIGGGTITSGWRVIPKDINFPTEDTVLAAISLDDSGFTHPLPADPANSDCTATFQEALNLVSSNGGGTVFVPEGQYRLNGTLTIPDYVTLRGRWRQLSAANPAAGTILKIYSGKNDASGTPFITVGNSGGVRDLTFWHPEQNPDAIVAYPFVIAPNGGPITIENITLVNAYQGINMSSASMCFIDNIQGTALFTGFYADRSYAVSRFDKLNFGPEYWQWADLPDATPVSTAYESYMLSNGLGIDIREMDGFHLTECKVRGMNIGLNFDASPVTSDNPHGDVMGVDLRNCNVAFQVASSKGIAIVNSYMQGINTGLKNLYSSLDIKINNATIIGGSDSIQSLTGASLNVSSCTLNGKISCAGELQLTASEFLNAGTDVELSPLLASAQIIGCSFADGSNILNFSGSSAEVIIDHNPAFGYSPAPIYPAKNMSIVRKPSSTVLFDITNYGATPNGGGNDSAGFGAAIAAANANGGGIVFVPNGSFDVSGSFTLASGVELRGTRGSRHNAGGHQGSMLLITGNEGNPDGPAFLNFGAGCGVRGITFHYPSQQASMLIPETIIAYPFTIRATGSNTYVADCFFSNPYRGVHFYQADDHLFENCLIGGLNRTILVQECTDGRIENFHIKPDFWRDIAIGNYPTTGSGTEQLKTYCGKYLNALTLKDSTNEVIADIFNHCSHRLLTVDESTGLVYLVGTEFTQRGYYFTGSKDFSMVRPIDNINNKGDGTGNYGTWLGPDFTGTVSTWLAGNEGNPSKSYYIQSGTINVQANTFSGPGERGNLNLEVNSGAILSFRSTKYDREFAADLALGSVVSIQDSYFDKGIPNTLLHDSSARLARNSYDSSYISTSANANEIVNDGMVLDPVNLSIEDALIFFGSSPYDPRKVTGASTSDGDYTIDVVGPDFVNGNSPSVTIETYFLVDTSCTILVYYDSKTGLKQGGSLTYDGLTNPAYKWINFSVGDAQFDGTNDIWIQITGDSPLLNTIWIYRNTNSVINFLPDLTKDGDVDLEDFAEVSNAWMLIYGFDALSNIAENWLVYNIGN